MSEKTNFPCVSKNSLWSFHASPRTAYEPIKNFKKYTFKCNPNIIWNPPQKLYKYNLNIILISFKYF